MNDLREKTNLRLNLWPERKMCEKYYKPQGIIQRNWNHGGKYEILRAGLGELQFSSVQLFSHVWLLATPRIVARQASLSITNSSSLLKLMSIESVMPSNHLILCRPLLLLPSIFPGIRVFSNESALCIRWPKYWSFSFNISSSNEHSGLISFRMEWLDLLLSKGFLRIFCNITVNSINSSALSLLHSPTLTSIHDHRKNHSLD